jgi:hypothetical protein
MGLAQVRFELRLGAATRSYRWQQNLGLGLETAMASSYWSPTTRQGPARSKDMHAFHS